jgi:glycosyltransferase involved in cell wall biosynthesis
MHYGVPRICEQRGALAHLYTDIAATTGWPRLLKHIPPILRPKALNRLLGRIPKDIPANKLTAFNSLGLEYWLRIARARSASELTAIHLDVGRRLCELANRSGFKGATHLYAFSSAGREFLEAGKNAGLHTIIEQPAMPKQVMENILRPEYERYSHWEHPPSMDRYHDDFVRRQWAEWRCADTIVVPSSYVAQGLREIGAPMDGCVVVPYGVDSSFRRIGRHAHNGPLRVLTVAGVRLLKGPQYTMLASKMLANEVEFRLVGPISISPSGHRELSRHVCLTGQVARSEIFAHYEWADVFLLPSLCEGMATVLIEALSAGLPIIATPSAGIAIRNGIDGFLVPSCDAEAIAARLDQLACNPTLLAQMSTNARERSQEFTLQAYGDRLFSALGATCEAG